VRREGKQLEEPISVYRPNELAASHNLVATYWTPADGMIAIGRGQAYAINDYNEVTGQYSLADGSKHAFIWKPGMRSPQDLGTLGNGWDILGKAINNLHHIADSADDDFGSGQISNYSYAAPSDISDNDEIVGGVFFGTPYVGLYVGPFGRTAFCPTSVEEIASPRPSTEPAKSPVLPNFQLATSTPCFGRHP